MTKTRRALSARLPEDYAARMAEEEKTYKEKQTHKLTTGYAPRCQLCGLSAMVAFGTNCKGAGQQGEGGNKA